MSDVRVRNFEWLQSRINAASEEVARWPDWKSHGSTLTRSDSTNHSKNEKTNQSSLPESQR
jgi:hypothetical protein